MLCYNCMRDKGDRDVCPFCNTGALKDPELHQLSPGTVIGGRYTVGKVLGEGGFGITYIGLDNTLDIVVAVKEYFPYGCSHRSSNITAEVSVSGGSGEVYRKGKDRFLKEAKTVAKFLKDPGIVDIRDFFEENNTAYIVMEYLEGVDLRKYLKAQGRMEPEEAFRLLIPVMRSLEKMHRVGIIHRDISPDNIMYQPDGTLKLMDFGAARDYDDSRSMSVMLKHGYAPEEQYRRGGEQGPWTDVYGLCATIYRCITGKAPDEAIDRLAEDHLKKPSELGVTISPELEKALMYGLAVRKKDRCPDMTELLRLIDKVLNVQKTAPAVEIKSAEKDSVEEVKTTLADHPEVADEKTSLASDLPAEEEVKTTLATHMPAGEEVKTTLATNMPAGEEVKTTLATNVPAGEEVKTTLATNMPAEEEVKTTLATNVPAEEEVKTTLATNMPAEEEVKTTLATNTPASVNATEPVSDENVTVRADITYTTEAQEKTLPADGGDYAFVRNHDAQLKVNQRNTTGATVLADTVNGTEDRKEALRLRADKGVPPVLLGVSISICAFLAILFHRYVKWVYWGKLERMIAICTAAVAVFLITYYVCKRFPKAIRGFNIAIVSLIAVSVVSIATNQIIFYINLEYISIPLLGILGAGVGLAYYSLRRSSSQLRDSAATRSPIWFVISYVLFALFLFISYAKPVHVTLSDSDMPEAFRATDVIIGCVGLLTLLFGIYALLRRVKKTSVFVFVILVLLAVAMVAVVIVGANLIRNDRRYYKNYVFACARIFMYLFAADIGVISGTLLSGVVPEKDRTLAADMTVAGDPEPLIPKKPPVIPPVTPSGIPDDTKKEKKPFPKAIIAVAAVLVAAIVILVIVNPFAKSNEPTKEEIAVQVSEMDKAAYQYLCEQIDVTDAFNEPWGDDYEHRRAIEFNHPDSISAKPIVIDTDFTAELSKTTAGDFKKTFSVNHVEEHTFDNGNQFEIELTSESSSGSFRIFTKLFSTPHSETDMDSCRIKEIILGDNIENNEAMIPFQYGNITEKTSLKEIVSNIGNPSMIYLYTDNDNKQKEVRSDFKLVYEGDGGFHIEFWLRYDMDKDSASISCADFSLVASSDESASSMVFSVDEDSAQARALENLVAYAQENFDLSEYDLYVDKDTGKNYYTYDYNDVITAFSTTFESSKDLKHSDFPMTVTVGGTEVTVGKDTPRDLMKKGWKEYTDFSELNNSKESQPFWMYGADSKLYHLYIEPTVEINPEGAIINEVVIWTDNESTVQYLDITQNTDIFTVLSKLGEPNTYRVTSATDNYIQLYYTISDTTEVSFDFIVGGETPELYAFYLKCRDDN